MPENFNFIIGIFVALLGLSFAYRFYRACILGKMNYWAGFLPISVISPLFLHIIPPPPPPPPNKRSSSKNEPPAKRTLIKEASGLWVHLILAPIFLVLAVLCLDAGCDLMGLPGTETLNYILNGGNKFAPRAVTYDKRYTFQFPIIVRALEKFGRRMDGAQIPLPADKQALRGHQAPQTRVEGY